MPEELSHLDSTILFLNSLQDEMAKANQIGGGSGGAKNPDEKGQRMPPTQIKRLNGSSKKEDQGKRISRAIKFCVSELSKI